MSLPIQLGDIIAASRLAWEIYRLGWGEEFSAASQYAEFGQEVRHLATNLDTISRVVNNALDLLRTRSRSVSVATSWDFSSLKEIIGDYHKTLLDCKKLLQDNQVYRQRGNAFANIRWNVLVQPTANSLQQRIVLHNSKVVFVLKPLEIDLLCRVHEDLAGRIDSLHADVRTLMGVLVPNFQQARTQQAIQELFTLEIPEYLDRNFQQMAEIDHENLSTGRDFPLDEISNAFVFHFKHSTVNYRAGFFSHEKLPSEEQYISLLKCVWLMKKIKSCPQLQSAGPQSHWPSYVKQLDTELSEQCSRFTADSRDQLQPPVLVNVPLDLLGIWPQGDVEPLFSPTHENHAMMKEVLNLPLDSRSELIMRSLKLSRSRNSTTTWFRVVESSLEQTERGHIRRDAPNLDFKLKSTRLVPLYALPIPGSSALNMMVITETRKTQFTFANAKGILKFQQALTGFKAYNSYSQQDVQVCFVVSNQSNPAVEDATLQLWIEKGIDGEESTATDSVTDGTMSIRTQAPSYMPAAQNGAIHQDSRSSFLTSPNLFQPFSFGDLSLQNPANTRKPRQSSLQSPTSPTSPRFGRTPSSSSSATTGSRRSSALDTLSRRSSALESVTSASSRGSESTVTTVDIDTGHGFIHRQPLRPMLVLFTQSSDPSRKLSIVTIQIDDETSVNVERCNCRKSSNRCPITAIERSKGKSNLVAQRYDAENGPEDCDIARVATANTTRRGEATDTAWTSLKRVSLQFTDNTLRHQFSGTVCKCKVFTQGDLKKCITAGHQGIFGEVKEFGRRQHVGYLKGHDNRRDLVMGRAGGEVFD